MKKITKSFLVVFLVLVMSLTSVTTYATEDIDANSSIMPRLSHMSDASLTFSATASGGYADVIYYGYDSFVRADLTVKVEKRFLWAFWNEIDEWSATSTETNGYFFHTFELTGSGTYRATFTLLITGNDGTVDTITDVIQSKY